MNSDTKMTNKVSRVMTRALQYGAVAAAATSALASRAMAAVNQSVQDGADFAGQGTLSATPLQDQIKTAINFLLFGIGLAAVIMLIFGGFQYIFSQGNKDNTTKAKDTILFAVIGIVVALVSYSVVNFVIFRFGN